MGNNRSSESRSASVIQEKEADMLGLGSTEMAVVYILCILAAIWCVVYGLWFWSEKDDPKLHQEVTDWEKDERELEKKLP
jgi:hypothetical protein